MKRICLLWVLVLIGCSGATVSKPDTLPRIEPDLAPMSVGELVNELLPDYPLSLYAAFPAEIRPLLRRSDIEDAMCRDGGWSGAQGLRGCNRRYDIQVALERRGWCYRGPGSRHTQTWVPCRGYPNYRPGHLEAEGPPRSAFDIAWVDDQDRRARGQPGSPELPALMRQLWREAEQALATRADEAGIRAFPIERY